MCRGDERTRISERGPITLSDTASSDRSKTTEAVAPRAFTRPLLEVVPNGPPPVRDTGRLFSLRVYQSLEDLLELEPLWDNLVAEYPLASIFCTWEWLVPWWRSFGKGRNLLVLALFDSASNLLGLAPLSTSREHFWGSVPLRVLRFMGDGSEDSDNLDFPVRPGFEEILARQVLQYLQDQRHQWDISQLNTMPLESPVAGCLVESLSPPRWSCFEYSRARLTVFLPPTWEEYLEQISPKERRNFMYYGRRLRKAYSVRIRRCTGESELTVCLEALFRLHRLRWQHAGEPGSFVSDARREFYADLSWRLLARKWLELWVAELDGTIAAVQFAMRYGNKVYSLQEGYDPDRASDRVGFILRGEVLRQLISEGVQVYDFLGGDDQHKARWKAKAGHYRDLHFALSWGKGGVLLNCAHRSLTTKEWLRGRLSSSAWSFLHKVNVAFRKRSSRAQSHPTKMLGRKETD